MTAPTSDFGKIYTVDMRRAELSAVHGREYELLLSHGGGLFTPVGIAQSTLAAWAELLPKPEQGAREPA